MPPLNRAFSLAKIDAVPVFVGEDLNLDVPRPLNVTLDVHIPVLESRRRFGRGCFQRVREFIFRIDDPHPAAAAAAGRLNDYGIANLARNCNRLFIRLEGIGTARQNRDARILHGASRFDFFTHQLNDVWPRSNELDIAGFANFSEVGGLSQKTVTRMNRVDVEQFRRADDCRDVQVALRGGRRANTHGLVGETHVERVAIDVAVYRDGPNAHLFTRPDDAAGDLAAIGDQNLAESALSVVHKK